MAVGGPQGLSCGPYTFAPLRLLEVAVAHLVAAKPKPKAAPKVNNSLLEIQSGRLKVSTQDWTNSIVFGSAQRLTVIQSVSQSGKQSVRQSVGQADRQTERHSLGFFSGGLGYKQRGANYASGKPVVEG